MSEPGVRGVPRRFLAVVALVASVVYLPSIFNLFAYDDVAVVQADKRIHSLGYLAKVFAQPYWAERGSEFAIYRPLTSASFVVDWAISQEYPMWFHIVNALWHAAACVLLLLVLAELFPPVAALVGALLFAVHPVHVEAVANVVGRGEVMSATLSFAALLLWLRAGARPRARTVIAVAALYLLAMLAKESAATLPAVLVLADAARGRWRLAPASLAAYLRRRAPALALLALALALELAARWAVIGRMGPAVVDAVFDVATSAPDRVRTALQAWPVYLRLLVFPRTLLADYGPRIMMPAFHWTGAAIAGAVLLAGCVIGGLAALATGRGRTALGLLWFPVTILPVSNLLFPTGILLAERTLYIPSVALSIAVAALAAAVMARRGHAAEPAPGDREAGGSGRAGSEAWRLAGSEARRPAGSEASRHSTAGEIASSPRPRVPASPRLAVAVLAVLAVLAMRSMLREPEWKSTRTIFAALERDAPESFRAQWDLARQARRAGNRAAAVPHFERALALWPHRKALVVEAGQNALELGRTERARELARSAQARWPADASVQKLVAAVKWAAPGRPAGAGVRPHVPLP